MAPRLSRWYPRKQTSNHGLVMPKRRTTLRRSKRVTLTRSNIDFRRVFRNANRPYPCPLVKPTRGLNPFVGSSCPRKTKNTWKAYTATRNAICWSFCKPSFLIRWPRKSCPIRTIPSFYRMPGRSCKPNRYFDL